MATRRIDNALLAQLETDANGMPLNAIRNNSTGNMLQIMSESAPQGPMLDYSRPMIQLADGRKGYYGKNDPMNVYDANGQKMTTLIPDAEAHNRAQDRAYQLQKRQMDLETERLQQEGMRQQLSGGKRPPAPAGYMWNAEGTGVVPIPGFEDQKPLTEAQGKSAVFGYRAQDSDRVIESVGNGGEVQTSLIKRAVEAIPVVGGALGMVANKFVASPDQQRIEQAQRDFINATLRQESGAVISDAEFDNARKQYFPQPGDTPDVIAQKAMNRQNVIKGFQVQAGPGWGRMQKQGAGQQSPSVSSIPKAAQEMLRANPLLREHFDAKYGNGASASILGG